MRGRSGGLRPGGLVRVLPSFGSARTAGHAASSLALRRSLLTNSLPYSYPSVSPQISQSVCQCVCVRACYKGRVCTSENALRENSFASSEAPWTERRPERLKPSVSNLYEVSDSFS